MCQKFLTTSRKVPKYLESRKIHLWISTTLNTSGHLKLMDSWNPVGPGVPVDPDNQPLDYIINQFPRVSLKQPETILRALEFL